ncbi:NDR1/HIN1-like protein 1 [Curcuma longa]|uniref:NDR1/HIN1-like protein 1 n=1 Tax=Curcuma longa TaxID=136217 RepID=UPI003D9F7EAC
MSAKDSDNQEPCGRRHGLRLRLRLRHLLTGLLLFVSLILLLILIIWLVLRPSKPKLYLQAVSIYQLNVTGCGAAPNLLTAVLQTTLSSRNPNDRVGIYYDELRAFAAFKGQRITAAAPLAAGYQGHHDVAVWSPYLYGACVPLAPYLAAALEEARATGLLLVEVEVEGRLRWKVGTWISGHYRLQANCPAFLTVSNRVGNGAGETPAFRFQQQLSTCTVDV